MRAARVKALVEGGPDRHWGEGFGAELRPCSSREPWPAHLFLGHLVLVGDEQVQPAAGVVFRYTRVHEVTTAGWPSKTPHACLTRPQVK